MHFRSAVCSLSELRDISNQSPRSVDQSKKQEIQQSTLRGLAIDQSDVQKNIIANQSAPRSKSAGSKIHQLQAINLESHQSQATGPKIHQSKSSSQEIHQSKSSSQEIHQSPPTNLQINQSEGGGGDSNQSNAGVSPAKLSATKNGGEPPAEIVSLNNRYVSSVLIERGIKLSPRALAQRSQQQQQEGGSF